ncbi:extracellular solute-binding protein, family 3 [Desulfatibacillum alkenivorans DSM 16219]|jgi:hypothetical protein|uniref:Extracellular solute-binding protein, family 3 n=1 Tax=Desulfatibacillum alkenivorans DSM 16219 TaxID=1121393 RepID=A0A1M6N209_9BACT|nr:transporter substrate-binding domain-containing protein [Desulfatibacillum alkenivorans]SHJ89730.1 extracellular solute-binding protein, family 3 [Desulfatibacillum alkenivorans DSM 16219]
MLKKILLAALLMLLWIPAPVFSADNEKTGRGALALTDEEQAWLNAHPVIRVSNELDYAPFDFVEYGKPRGFSVDYFNLVAERAGFKVEYIQDFWDVLLKMCALESIREGRGGHFDPDMVDAFMEIADRFMEVALEFADFDEERQALLADA